jgi:hypothetical protein
MVHGLEVSTCLNVAVFAFVQKRPSLSQGNLDNNRSTPTSEVGVMNDMKTKWYEDAGKKIFDESSYGDGF